MDLTLNRIVANPLGRVAYLLARPIIHFMRRTANPGLPNDHVLARVQCGDRELLLQHRRWSQDDALAIKQCFEQRQYDMPVGIHGAIVQKFHDEIVASGRQPLIVDCGANIGASVAWFAARYPKAHIVAIEPAPDNFAFLSRNTAGMDVDLRLAGIAAEDGHAYLKSCGSDMGYQTIAEEEGPPVEMLSVASVLAAKPESKYAPFLLKVDIEGAEGPLFSGDTSAFERFPLIILEPHDWMLPGKLSSQPFLRFHAGAGREFCMHHENIASIALRPASP